MAKRIQQRVNINGETRWISGSTQQELFDAYLEQAIRAGIVINPQQTTSGSIISPLFGDYLIQFVRVYKSKQEALTMRTRDMTIRKHILPRLDAVPIGEIKTADIQVWFDELCEQGYLLLQIIKHLCGKELPHCHFQTVAELLHQIDRYLFTAQIKHTMSMSKDMLIPSLLDILLTEVL